MNQYVVGNIAGLYSQQATRNNDSERFKNVISMIEKHRNKKQANLFDKSNMSSLYSNSYENNNNSYHNMSKVESNINESSISHYELADVFGNTLIKQRQVKSYNNQ